MRTTRRAVSRAVGVGGLALLAGCGSPGGGDEEGEDGEGGEGEDGDEGDDGGDYEVDESAAVTGPE